MYISIYSDSLSSPLSSTKYKAYFCQKVHFVSLPIIFMDMMNCFNEGMNRIINMF